MVERRSSNRSSIKNEEELESIKNEEDPATEVALRLILQ